jgi:VWFA-related protein
MFGKHQNQIFTSSRLHGYPSAFTSLILFTSLLLCASIQAQSQKPPVFRGRIDLMQLDVTVLDKNGVPVRGLTKDDFTLLEDNKPQTIQGFSAVDVPERTAPGPAWDKKATPDVTTNEIDNARIFVLVLDDGLGVGCCTELMEEVAKPGGSPPPPVRQRPNPWAAKELQKTAALFIDMLGPKDLAAVVFTGATYRSNQGLTADRNKLTKAVAAYPVNDGTLFFDPGTPPAGVKPIPQCLASKQIVMMVDSVVTSLATLPDRRKSIIYFGGSLPWATTAGTWCGTHWMWQDVFAHAQQAHVTINPVQTAGLTAGSIGWNDRYLAVADNTGGHAVVNTNDFAPGIRQIFLENSSYYLIAYQPTKDVADGTFRKITVKVNRPDLEVRSRRSYWAPRETPPDKPAPEPPPPQVEAMAGILPTSTLSLRAAAAPFGVPGTDKAEIAVALGVKLPALASRTPESVDLLLKAFTADNEAASDNPVISVTLPAARADADVSRYDVLARIAVPKPGKYELRITAHSDLVNTRGSVYVDVDVPDFRKDKLSLSGVIVNAIPGTGPTAPARLFNDLTPVAPTTERTFAATDIVTAALRVYQGAGEKPVAVPIKVTIQDAAGKSVLEKADTLAADRFSADHAADYQFRLPLAALKAGEYLLTFEATAGKATARRDVRFSIR